MKERMTGGDWCVLALGTGLFVGMIPPATATLATLWGIPIAIGLYEAFGWSGYAAALVALWLFGVPLTARCAAILQTADPSEVTYDEFVTLPWVYLFVPRFSWQIVLIGYVLHRLLDAFKPLGIRRLETLPGGWGIMADDLAASLVAFALLQALLAVGVVG